jgi:hypothetical protein
MRLTYAGDSPCWSRSEANVCLLCLSRHRRYYLPFLTMSGDVTQGSAHIGKLGSQRRGGERIANIVLWSLQALEESEELVARVVPGRSAIGWYGSRECLLLHRQGCLEIDHMCCSTYSVPTTRKLGQAAMQNCSLFRLYPESAVVSGRASLARGR